MELVQKIIIKKENNYVNAYAKRNYIDKTIEELVVLRNQKLEKLKDYENKFIFSKPDPLEIFPKPSPHIAYNMDNEDLIMLT